MLNCELREGKQHCQNGTPDFLKHTIRSANQIVGHNQLLFRLDGGNDETVPDIDIIFKVTKRFQAKDGTVLLFPEIEEQTLWTN